MRHKLPILVAMLALAGMTFAVAASGGGNGAVRIPSPLAPFDIPSSLCGFPVHADPGAQNLYIIHSTTLQDGTTITRTTGKFFVTLTNTDTGKAYTANITGPVTQTLYSDGRFVFDGQGHSLFGFTLTGQPGLIITSGHVVATFDVTGLTSFTLDGTYTDVCALLGP